MSLIETTQMFERWIRHQPPCRQLVSNKLKPVRQLELVSAVTVRIERVQKEVRPDIL